MPSVKMKTHKGAKKRFKVSANGKVSHKRCGSSHLNSHKSGSQIRKLRKKSVVKIGAEARRLRHAIRTRENQLGLSNETKELIRRPSDEDEGADEAPAAPQA
jgi:large subunit ribosomal protein L35